MGLPGETITGVNGTGELSCEDCGELLPLRVLRSNAGYYIGTFCNCGPYSRESDYYETPEEAEADLKTGDFGR